MRSKPVRILTLGLPLALLGAQFVGPSPVAANAAGANGASQIQHVVVLMQENRSFDHYFGQLPNEGQPAVNGEPANASNPNPLNPSGPPITVFHKTPYCEVADLDHSWNGTHKEWDGGKMDGFTAANVNPADPTGSRTMGYYDQRDLPFYYALDNTFAVGDHYFASALTQTFPNRFYLLAGTSFGHIRNDFPGATGYTAAAGTLPQVSFVDPIFVATNTVENDEHPPSNVQVGENFAANVIYALFKSPNWGSSAMFLTYDEHGGFYDHLPPPSAIPPDGIPPMLISGDTPGAFDRYGIRVPVTVISPYARSHFVSHVVNDHTSILHFIETRFDLGTLTRRDAAANPMLEFFNFKNAAFATPPALPAAPIDPAQLAACASMPSNTGV